MANFVLIHGTTQGPAGWDRLVNELDARGHRARAVDLDSSEDRALSDYILEIQTQVPADFSDPVVVAHSGSGVLLPQAARALAARHQVWLAAYIPDGRHSLLDEVTASAADVFNPEWIGKDPTSDPVLAAYFLFHDCDLETLQWALTTLRLFAPRRLYAEPVELATDIASTYVVATRDRTLLPSWCRQEASRRLAADIVDIETGHCPHVSRPDELAALLDDVARTGHASRADRG